jgi:hypothetical protein
MGRGETLTFPPKTVRPRVRSASPSARVRSSVSPERRAGASSSSSSSRRPMSSYSVLQAASYPRPAAAAVGVQAAPLDLRHGLSVLAFNPGALRNPPVVWRHRWCWEGQYLRSSHDQLGVRAWQWREASG